MDQEFSGENVDLTKKDQKEIEEEQGDKLDEIDNEISSVEEDIDPQVWKGDDDFNEEMNPEENKAEENATNPLEDLEFRTNKP